MMRLKARNYLHRHQLSMSTPLPLDIRNISPGMFRPYSNPDPDLRSSPERKGPAQYSKQHRIGGSSGPTSAPTYDGDELRGSELPPPPPEIDVDTASTEYQEHVTEDVPSLPSRSDPDLRSSP